MKQFLVFILICTAAVVGHAQSTAFTYQGRLAVNGAPYSGLADVQFQLFSAPTGGLAVATNTPAVATVDVRNGGFTVLLDFGAQPFSGPDRWLEVQVRTTLGAYTTLNPRQPLTPAPHALHARTAGTSQGQWVSGKTDSSSGKTDLSYTAGQVGIGVGGTTATLDLRGNIRFGTNGEYRATGSPENVRAIRGSVQGNGHIIEGESFIVTRIREGDYRVDFQPPFANAPTVIATVDDSAESLSKAYYYVAGVYNANETWVRIRTRQKASSLPEKTGASDQACHFIAIGPR